jgi:hypothetical protein
MGLIDHGLIFSRCRHIPHRGALSASQAPPAVDVVVLPLLEVGRVFRQPLREPGLEHERHGVGELDRLELAVACVLEGGLIRSVGQHAIMQRRGLVFIFICGDGGEEVARIGEAIGADRSAIGQRESAAVVVHSLPHSHFNR